MIVKYQQITPVIDRRRTMFPNDPTARFAARTTVVRIHHTERRSRADSPSRRRKQLLRRKIPGQDHHVVRTRTIQAKSRIFRLVFPPRRNLRTSSALVDHKCRITFFVFCIRQSPNKFGFAFTYRKCPVATVEKSVLQLHRPPVKDSDPTQGIVKAVLSVVQPMKHKRFAHKSVNEWRVHAVPPEMTGPGEPVGQPGNTAKAAA